MRNNISYLFCLIVSVFFTFCSTPKEAISFQRTGEVNCVEKTDRSVTLRSKYYAGDPVTAEEFAVINALENMLFKGVEGCRERPIVANENKAKSEFGNYFNQLINDRGYMKFVTDRKVLSGGNARSTNIEMDVTFDLDALTNDLKENGIIKKFGI